MDDLKNLRLLAKNIKILYVEDNDKLRDNVQKLLQKFFDIVDTASDGQDGLELFRKHKHALVLTDIKMPSMDGIALSKEIRAINSQTKIIILSAFDDKEFLYDFMELKIFKFLKKPINVSLLTDTLYNAVKEIKNEKALAQFNIYVDDAFNHQSSMVLLLNADKVKIANHVFLEFFNVESIKAFYEEYGDLGLVFIEHDGFLYNKLDKTWLDEVKQNEQKHFNVKIKTKDNQAHHFLLKYKKSQINKDYSIISLEDITDLNLMHQPKKVEKIDSSSIFKLLESLKNNNSKLDIHNYYKGLSITNSATIRSIKDDSITIKTAFLQQKAIKYEGKTLIVSETLPYPILSEEVEVVGFEMEYSELGKLKFVDTSPISRKTIRLVPEENHKVSLFIGEKEFNGNIKIEDISLDAVKLKLNALPAGLNKSDEITPKITLEMDDEPLIINTKATVLRQSESADSFSVVFFFQYLKKTQLIKYITKRQMVIIREFKGL